ncbi:KpsF/GutQ family sugar-phosphate isomerase [Solidesulfovibrio alcoholivorans]|uniref:KpsF/GutQ family sugar-phosphate isomerase n=1 Tax=Solidesulfovibrio alcoholivorans TaxID=81406 RepID=UPI000A016D3E|nr:KpsF/GutQ family sugar-phosphate isomerase [Solidesulfovibrio alcoholivorans]
MRMGKNTGEKLMDYSSIAVTVLNIEARAILQTAKTIGCNLNEIIEAILRSKGKVVVSGIGKSGHIAEKISSTLNSTGTMSFFLHPAEAFHGDLGMVGVEDIILFFSYSGETEEIIRLIPYLKRNGNVTISVTGNICSSLAAHSNFCINIGDIEEACPLGLAPTSSTTAMLAVGDAIAMILMQANGFQKENFAKFHPGGSLGRKLLKTVSDFSVPAATIFIDDNSEAIISKLASDKNGIICVIENEALVGVITDGDIKRSLKNGVHDFLSKRARDLMSSNPKVVEQGTLCGDADELMKKIKINSLVVRMTDGTYGIYHNLNRS